MLSIARRTFKVRLALNLVLILSLCLSSSSCLKQGQTTSIPGVDSPIINIVDGKVMLTIGFKYIDIPGSFTFGIPNTKGSSATLGPRTNGGSLIRVLLEPQDLISDEFNNIPTQTLPDGRPFPFIMGGTLPAVAFEAPELLNTTFYLSQEAFGLFIPIEFPNEVIFNITSDIVINDKKIGIFSIIPNSTDGEGSGLVIMLSISEINKHKEMQRLINYSKKSKNRGVLF